ncbi:ANK-REP-region domain-containing protein [Favolaschia claudopus]|uniref:ANK-REP-region domain-containing protein n=1 Tax=Favolaschia claudopus TaxID=2862362 RepID=A0AAW0EDI1_9AGAR
MAVLLDLPPELVLHIVSFLNRETVLDKDNWLPAFNHRNRHPELAPDVPSINAFSQTNTALYHTLNRYLYNDICEKHDTIGKLSLLSAVRFQSERALDKLVAAGVSLDADFVLEYNVCGILHVAAALGLRAMVSKLLEMYGPEMEAKVHARRGYGLNATALDYAARHRYVEIVWLLAPVPVPSSVSDSTKERRTYLSFALLHSVKAKSTEVSEYLVSQGADVNYLGGDTHGGTPLYFAAGTDNLELVQFLLSAGANPNLYHDANDSIPLFNAARNHRIDIAEALLAAGADLDAKNRNSRNVLSCCTDIDALRFFLEYGVDVNLEDRIGETPLHHACSEEDAEFALASVELLLQYGAATVEKANWRRQTPVDIAIAEGYTEIVELLEPLVESSALKDKISMWLEDT